MFNKKGQFKDFGGLAVGLATVAILLVVAFLILDQGRDQTNALASTISNSTGDTVASVTTDVFFTVDGRCNPEYDMTITSIYNNSVGPFSDVIDAANYTVSGYRVNLSNDLMPGLSGSSVGWNTSGINVSWSCQEADFAYNSTATLTNATAEVPSWMSLIVIVVVGAVLLGLVALIRNRRL